MPIYAYKCDACGHEKDVLQKVSDPVLTTCPACGAQAFRKQVTAAGFQLKGSGWYVTDFRGGSAGAKPAESSSGSDASGAAKSDAGTTSDTGAAKAPAAAAPGTPAASAGASPAAD